MEVDGHFEQRYWDREEGRLVATAEPGPPDVVEVHGDGTVVHNGRKLSGSGHARWLGTRLIEAATLAEMEVTRGPMAVRGVRGAEPG